MRTAMSFENKAKKKETASVRLAGKGGEGPPPDGTSLQPKLWWCSCRNFADSG